MLITLMLAMTLAAMAMLAILPEMGQQIRRDREEELCHRGTQYMRAIQHFYKKVGRYPTRIEELEDTNHIRYLRRRYKDPLSRDPQTGKERDFKFLHMQDVSLNNGPVMPGAMIPGQGIPGQGLPGQNGLQGVLGQVQQLQQLQQAGGASAVQNNAAEDQSGSGNSGNQQGSSSSSSSPSSSPFASSSGGTGSSAGAGLGGQVFGGGPILGVASTSKAKTIREYNKKNHYNDWLFMYDPTSDRGGPLGSLLVGPWQTPSMSTIPGANPIGQPMQGTQSGPGNSGFGQSNSPFGGSQFGQPPSQPPQNQGGNPQQQQ